jgi:hypothetical protein
MAMTNLLLITDIPRLRKIFTRLFDDADLHLHIASSPERRGEDFHLRIASSLERGSEEIAADKPAMVFVQTHLSGLSADILVKHLKKQLGRKRTRFVLLSPPEQISDEILNLYQGHIDTSLDDYSLSNAIRETITGHGAKGKPVSPTPEAPAVSPLPQQEEHAPEPVSLHNFADAGDQQHTAPPAPPAPPAPLILPQLTGGNASSLEEQGVTYAPRSRVAVYSEFTSSFDTAVNSMQPAAPVGDTPATPPAHEWDYGQIETLEPEATRSKRTTFLLWFVPVLVVAVIVTVLQHRKPRPTTTVEVVPVKPAARPHAPAATPQAPVAALQPQAAPSQAPAAAPAANVIQPAAAIPSAPAMQQPATGAAAQTSDRAVMAAIADNRGSKAAPALTRLTELPDFIPRAGLDKQYGAANPGWQRYKGHSTEFKVYREGSSIKAIQVIDRGSKGVPESFMKGVLKQVSKKPVFVLGASEKKDGYEIQRGQVADNLKVVYYRDERGGTIRAFVLTWQ